LGGVRQTSPSAEVATGYEAKECRKSSRSSLAVPFLLLIHLIYQQFQF
jgi:hypothetical protein